PFYNGESGSQTIKWDLIGSASGMTAYMVALMQNKLVDEEACDSIRGYLADKGELVAVDYLLQGVGSISDSTHSQVAWAHTKVGISGEMTVSGVTHKAGEVVADFAYIETAGTRQSQFGIVLAGVRAIPIAPAALDADDIKFLELDPATAAF